MENQHKILLVEDDIPLSDWIADYLRTKHFDVQQCDDGAEAARLIIEESPDLVILDGMLPTMDGWQVCKTVREKYAGKIIMLTARDEEIDEVLGLEMGADDYLTKPVRARALLTRIQKQLASSEKSIAAENDPQRIQVGNLDIHAGNRTVMRNHEDLKLSSNEFDLLWALAQKAGQVVSRDELIQAARGFEYDGFDRTIDLRVSKLRKKLGDDPQSPTQIKTVWGKGYQLAISS